MKKIVVSALVLIILLAGYFAFSVYYTNKKVDAFFNHNGGVLYESSGLKWKLAEAKTTFFKGSYKTEVSINNKPLATMEHKAIFGMRANPFEIGSLDTKGKIILNSDETLEALQQEFDIKSSIAVGGIESSISINGGNASTYDIYSGEDENVTWQDIKASFFISFERDKFDFDADIPFFRFDGAFGKFFVLEGQRYKSRSNKKEDLWIGDSDININKLDFSDGYSIGFLLSKFNMGSNVDIGESSTIKNTNKISFDEFKYSNTDIGTDILLNDITLNFNLGNLDLESMKKISEAMQQMDTADENQAVTVLYSLFEYMSDILAKHPKIVLEEFSGKYDNHSVKISGFAQYIGSGDFMNLYANLDLDKDVVMKMDFEFAQEALRKYFEQEINMNYYGYEFEDGMAYQERLDEEVALGIEAFEEDTGIRVDGGGLYKGTLEFKDGDFLLNGRLYESAAEESYDY